MAEIIIEEVIFNPQINIEETILETSILIEEIQMPGVNGKTAYQSALDGGFIGTELEFNLFLSEVGNKVDKITGKGLSANDYTTTEKNKLAGIALGAEVNVNADWNATTGDAQILNKPSIPTQTSQLTNNGADGTNPFITALDIPTSGQAGSLVREVKNMTGATLTKGTVVYISGANGNKALVSKALAINDELSSRTFGLLQSDISNNGLGNCVIIGDLSGLNTSSFAEGVQLYLSGVTAGTYTSTKPSAPIHLVYIGKVTRSHTTLGQIEVGIQNGYELSEIHDVSINGVSNNELLLYESSTSLWKNKRVTTFVNGQSGTVNATNTFGIIVYEFTGAGNLILPTAIGNNALFKVKNRHTENITVTFTAGQNADGTTTIILTPFQALEFISNNTNYNIF